MRPRSSQLSTAVFAVVGAWIAYAHGPSHGQEKAEAPPQLSIAPVVDDLYVIQGGNAGNVAVYVTGEGVILVDDGYERDHAQIMEQVRRVTTQPVKYVLNTHYHGDHSGGNAKMLPLAEVISTATGRGQIRQGTPHNNPGAGSAARLTFTDELSVFLGGKEVRARYFGRAHTNTDAFIYFPSLRVIHGGDMVNNNTSRNGSFYAPLIDYAGGGSIVEWTKTLDAVVTQWNFDVVIPGHGPAMTRTGLLSFRNSVEAMRTRVQAFIRQGKSDAEVQQFLGDQYFGYNNPAMNWGFPGILNELR